MAKVKAHNSKVYAVFKKLLKEYGKQHWWPAESEYEIVVGAVLTQNTNWKNVEKALENLKKANALHPEKILSMPEEKLKELIRPAGFFNQKASRLKAITKKYLELKELLSKRKMKMEEMRKELLSVKGIGKETADSILLYAFGMPIFVVDAYTRYFSKYFFNFEGKSYEDYQRFFEENLPKDTYIFNEYHALIVEWGKRNKKIIREIKNLLRQNRRLREKHERR